MPLNAKKQSLLEAFKVTGTVIVATRAAGVSRASHYRWLREDRRYKEEFERIACDQAAAILGTLARARGEGALLSKAAAAARKKWESRPLNQAIKTRVAAQRRAGLNAVRLMADESPLARERDSLRCCICGFSAQVWVRQIVPESEGGDRKLGNLITLCPNHHTMAQMGLLTVAELQRALAQPAFCAGAQQRVGLPLP